MNYYLIVFKNTLDAMNGEQKLKGKGYSFKMMPTPTAITQSCGICIRSEVKEDIDIIIKDSIIEYKNIFIRQEKEFVKIV